MPFGKKFVWFLPLLRMTNATPGTLYVVGTPIGNLGDVTSRIKEILSSVDVVLCEDTRVSRTLLAHIGSTARMVSLHQHSTPAQLERIVLDIVGGKTAAYISDAGTPGISDPGGKLVDVAYGHGVSVVGIPGPSAVTTALSISGFPTDSFLFLGFLPHKKGRETLFRRIAETEETVVLYESPHRLLKTLDSLLRLRLNRRIAVCRELTKMHESVIRGSVEEVQKHFLDHPDQVRGEIVLIIAPE